MLLIASADCIQSAVADPDLPLTVVVAVILQDLELLLVFDCHCTAPVVVFKVAAEFDVFTA